MPRPSKGARLWLRPDRIDNRGVHRPAAYVILDAGRQVATGFGFGQAAEAEGALQQYLSAKHDSAPKPTGQTAAEVYLADLIAEYSVERQAYDSKPRALIARCEQLVLWWGDRTVADVTAATCKAYWESRTTPLSARRELEDMSAAINMGIANGRLRDQVVKVTLPRKAEARTHWLTRDDFAAFLLDLWRHKQKPRVSKTGKPNPKGQGAPRYTARHVAKFALVALYTAGRSARIYRASYYQEEGRPYVDLEEGVYYRRWSGERKRANKKAPPIRIPARLLAHMRRWAGWNPETGEITKDRYVCEWKGKPVDPKIAYARAMKRTGILAHRHTLRHSAVTWLARAGVDPDEICGFAGFSLQVFKDVYSHHHPDFQTGVSDAFSSGRAGRPKRPIKPSKRQNDEDEDGAGIAASGGLVPTFANETP